MIRGSSSQASLDEAPGLPAMLRRFWPLVWKERLVLGGSFVALLAEVGLRLLEPWPLKFVFDYVIAADPAAARDVPVVGPIGPMTLLTLAALSVVVIMGLRSLAVYFNTVGLTLAGNRILTEIRGDVYRHLQSLSLSFHHRQRQGDLTLRLLSDVGVLKDVILTAFFPLLVNVLVLIGMLTTMFWLDVRLGFITAAVLPCFWLVSARFGRRIRTASRIQRRREGALASTAAESVAAIKVVQALSLESAFEESFTNVNRGSLSDSEKVSRLAAGLARIVDVFIAIATAAVLWYGTTLVLARELSPGDLLVFLTYLKNAFRPVHDFAKYSARLARGSAAAERVLDLMGRTPEVRDLPGAVAAPAFSGAVKFDAVSFGYEPDVLALHGIRLAVEPGQRIALTGPSGGGKSTLLSLLLRLYDPLEGRVLIDGREIREFTIASLRRQITIVLQDTVLFAASASDNIAYGLPNASPAEIEAAARLANAHDFIQKLPEGYETVFGERGVTLSTGQRQRIAIARAAIRHSPILILDEPTTALDESNARAVIEALERVTRGSTTFLVTHDPRLATTADLVVYMEAGQIVEQGPPAALLRAGGQYARLHHLHATGRHIAGDAIAVTG